MKRILYIRSGPYQVELNSYNLQELGLASSLYKLGYQCDIMYYHRKKNYEQKILKNGIEIRILWRHGIKLFRTGIYLSMLNKNFLKQYDYVICSEYSQIMSVLMCRQFKNTYIYNGAYYNLFKIPFMERIYDKLFCHYINKKVQKVFCKTKMAEEYMHKKGINNTITVGVGLDTEKFDKAMEVKQNTQEILNKMKGHRNLLYIGSIIKRKNIEILIKAFVEVKKANSMQDLQLVLIGEGNRKYTEYCNSLLPNDLKKDVIWCRYIENAQTKFIYEEANIFILPSTQEIFGMVLLEAMYFGKPTIASCSAGATTLIENRKNGILIEKFEVKEWANALELLLNNNEKAKKMGECAMQTIKNEFMWNKIVTKMQESF